MQIIRRPQLQSVSHGFLTTMGAPLIAGRDFAASDTANAPPVIVKRRSIAFLSPRKLGPVGVIRRSFAGYAVSRAGAMSGPHTDLYGEFIARYPTLELQASGGVRHVADLQALADLGAPAAITGRALLDGKIDVEELGPFLRVA